MPIHENLPMTVLIYTNNILYLRYFTPLFFRCSDVLSLLLNRGMIWCPAWSNLHFSHDWNMRNRRIYQKFHQHFSLFVINVTKGFTLGYQLNSNKCKFGRQVIVHWKLTTIRFLEVILNSGNCKVVQAVSWYFMTLNFRSF